MSGIQRIPRGLLSLLDMKSAAGRTPADLQTFIQGTIDLEAYYLSDALSTAFTLVNVAAAGVNAQLLVPQGEVWRLFGLSAVADGFSAAVTTVGFGVQIRPPGAPASWDVGFRDRTATVAVTDRLVATAQIPPTVLGSGTIIQAFSSITPAPNNYNLAVVALFHRLVA